MLAGSVRVLSADLLMLPTGLLTTAYLTRQLGPERYGVFIVQGDTVRDGERDAFLVFLMDPVVNRIHLKPVPRIEIGHR